MNGFLCRNSVLQPLLDAARRFCGYIRGDGPSNNGRVTDITDTGFGRPHNHNFSMTRLGPIRLTLTAMLALVIALWAEAGLALLPGDQVMQCRAMVLHGRAHAMTTSDATAADAEDSDAMPCCPADTSRVPKATSSHPPCCSSNDAPERPLAFLIGPERLTSHPSEMDARAAILFAPPLAQLAGELRSADAPRCVKPVLDLKSDLRI